MRCTDLRERLLLEESEGGLAGGAGLGGNDDFSVKGDDDSICRNLASIIAIFLEVLISERPTPVLFTILKAVGVLSAFLGRPPYDPLISELLKGAWCANVTTSFRPRRSLPLAPAKALSAP